MKAKLIQEGDAPVIDIGELFIPDSLMYYAKLGYTLEFTVKILDFAKNEVYVTNKLTPGDVPEPFWMNKEDIPEKLEKVREEFANLDSSISWNG